MQPTRRRPPSKLMVKIAIGWWVFFIIAFLGTMFSMFPIKMFFIWLSVTAGFIGLFVMSIWSTSILEQNKNAKKNNGG